jgi:hypothetical protein
MSCSLSPVLLTAPELVYHGAIAAPPVDDGIQNQRSWSPLMENNIIGCYPVFKRNRCSFPPNP